MVHRLNKIGIAAVIKIKRLSMSHPATTRSTSMGNVGDLIGGLAVLEVMGATLIGA